MHPSPVASNRQQLWSHSLSAVIAIAGFINNSGTSGFLRGILAHGTGCRAERAAAAASGPQSLPADAAFLRTSAGLCI